MSLVLWRAKHSPRLLLIAFNARIALRKAPLIITRRDASETWSLIQSLAGHFVGSHESRSRKRHLLPLTWIRVEALDTSHRRTVS
jgi:hypothetical protein